MKLKKEDLRIGNTISTPGFTVTVNAKLLSAFESNKDYIKLYKGINLTEEWIPKLGLKIKESERGVRYIELNVVLNLLIVNDSNKGTLHLILSSEDNYTDLQTRIYYVHELQNIFKEIAKFELKTIK